MKCVAGLAVVTVSLLVASVTAGSDSVDDLLRRELDMELFPRQQQRVLVANLQAFTGNKGNAPASAITSSGNTDRPFEVDGDTFTDFQSAANRACDNQKNTCAKTANNGSDTTLQVSDCDTQNTQCKAAASSATATAFATLTTSDSQFDFFCEQ